MTEKIRITLDGDDASELVSELEHRLAFKFQPDDIDYGLTLGDFRDAALRQIDPDWAENTRCLEAMTFIESDALSRAAELTTSSRRPSSAQFPPPPSSLSDCG